MEKLNLGWLKQARYRKHLTVRQVAAALSKGRAAVWRYEAGQTSPTVAVLCKMLDLYGVSVSDVFCRDVGEKK